MILGDAYRTLWGRDWLEEELCGLTFRLSVPSFFQINRDQTERLYQLALEFAGLTGEETVLDRLFASLHTNKYLEEQIRSAILDEETIADTASSELADIRRKMRLAASKGRQILQRIISSPSYAKVLQEALITQRDGRFVVPVKAECKAVCPAWSTTSPPPGPRCLWSPWVWCRPTMS